MCRQRIWTATLFWVLFVQCFPLPFPFTLSLSLVLNFRWWVYWACVKYLPTQGLLAASKTKAWVAQDLTDATIQRSSETPSLRRLPKQLKAKVCTSFAVTVFFPVGAFCEMVTILLKLAPHPPQTKQNQKKANKKTPLSLRKMLAVSDVN